MLTHTRLGRKKVVGLLRAEGVASPRIVLELREGSFLLHYLDLGLVSTPRAYTTLGVVIRELREEFGDDLSLRLIDQ